MKEILLSLDTSSANSYVTVDLGDVSYTGSTKGENSHNEEIHKLVKSVVEKAGINFNDFTALVIGSGPGSFTGLRIGYAYMKGLACGLKLPLYSYSSMDSAAYTFAKNPEFGNDFKLCCLGKAGRGEYFTIIQSVREGKVETLLEAVILDAAAVQHRLKDVSGDMYVVNFGSEELPDFSAYKAASMPNLSDAVIEQHKAIAGSVPARVFDLQEIAEIEPFYLREVAARTLKDRGINI